MVLNYVVLGRGRTCYRIISMHCLKILGSLSLAWYHKSYMRLLMLWKSTVFQYSREKDIIHVYLLEERDSTLWLNIPGKEHFDELLAKGYLCQ